jgi:pyruvate,orthophosphate dikinase
MSESNPMLGHRGYRLGISYREITEMPSIAIFEAAAKVKSEGIDVRPEIMVSLTIFVAKFKHQAKIIRETAEAVKQRLGVSLSTK